MTSTRCRACLKTNGHMRGCPLAQVVREHDGRTGPVVLKRNGSTRQWRRLRALILKRDGYRCQNPECKTPGGLYDPSGRHLDIDHIIPHADGGSDDPSNLRVWCYVCNRGRRD